VVFELTRGFCRATYIEPLVQTMIFTYSLDDQLT
jgi:hypothetical protein